MDAKRYAQIRDAFIRIADAPASQRPELLARLGQDDPELRAEVEKLLRSSAGGPDAAGPETPGDGIDPRLERALGEAAGDILRAGNRTGRARDALAELLSDRETQGAPDAGDHPTPAPVTPDSDPTSPTGPDSGRGFGRDDSDDLKHALIGTTVAGRYRVLGPLGEGGFGLVYEAEQTAPVRRRVALKVLKPGMDTRSIVARFEGERQALAMMDHPCIAKVLDAGETDRGLPFFVMELVRGISITAYCDKHRLTVTERLDLFGRVCDAIQHAHTKAIIHRDIKPSNILVERLSDGTAVPRVIDFGIAKALSQRLSEHTVFTERGQMIGTPEYMSPEQAEMSAEAIDTRSDIYSLGVLLYELLTGLRPFDSETLRSAGLAEIHRILREVDPPRPSLRLDSEVRSSGPRTGGSAVAASRRTELRSLTTVLRRDLDWVVMKCLEKSRERRYSTAQELAADVRRFLMGEAVLAGPPTVRYRLGKFVGRHRAGVAVAFVLATVVAGALLATTAGLRAARIQRDRAQAALSEAASARLETEETLQFFLDRFGALDPESGQVLDATELAAIRRVLIEIESALRADVSLSDGTRARTLIALGDLYRGMSEFEAAGRMGAAGLELADRLGTAEVRVAARMLLAEIAYRVGVAEEGERLASEAFALAQAAGADKVRMASIVTDRGNAFKHMGRPIEALRAYSEAEQLLAGATGREAELQLASTLYNRGLAAWRVAGDESARLKASLVAFERALDLRTRWLGGDEPPVLNIRLERAGMVVRAGEHERAIADYEAALPFLERELPAEHWRLNEYRLNYGTALYRAGRFEQALQVCREAYEGYVAGVGADSCATVLAGALVARAAVAAGSGDASGWVIQMTEAAERHGCTQAAEVLAKLRHEGENADP